MDTPEQPHGRDEEHAAISPRPPRPRREPWVRWLEVAVLSIVLVAVGIIVAPLIRSLFAPPQEEVPRDEPVHGMAPQVWLVYATEETGETSEKVMMVRPDGTGARELPMDISDGSELAAVSRDGQWAVTCFAYDAASRLTLWKTDGTVNRALTDVEKGELEMDDGPVFSRDGRHLLLTRVSIGSATTPTTHTPMALELPDGMPKPVSPQEFDAMACASPDGSLVVTARDGDLFVANRDGTGRRRLLPTRGERHSPCFTPDGKHIVYVVHPDPRVWPCSDIAIVGIDGKGAKKLTDVRKDKDAAAYVAPAVRPDGREIAYVRLHQDGFTAADGDEEVPLYRGTIYLMNLDGTDKRRFVAGTSPHWVLREE